MTRETILRIGVYVGAILCICLILFISITRHTLHQPSLAERQSQNTVSAATRIDELRTWPPLPDHPLYALRMASDRLRLSLRGPESRIGLSMQFADDRFASAQVLLSRGRFALALTTLTKSAKYSLAAAHQTDTLSADHSSRMRADVQSHVARQIERLERIKSSFSDEQKAVIDRLIAELSVLQTRL